MNKVRAWILARSGWTLLGLLVVLGLAVQPLWRISPGLPSGLAFVGYLAWMVAVFMELRDCGRQWSRSPVAWLPFVVLACFVLVVHPIRESGTNETTKLNMAASGVAVLSYLLVWDHIAVSLTRRRASGIGWYVLTLLVSLMPPLTVPLVQHEVRHEVGG